MNRKIDDILSGKKDRPNSFYVTALAIVLGLTILGLILVSTFIGFVYQNYFAGQAGYVYNMVIDYRECAWAWSGLYGAAVMVQGYNNPQQAQLSSCGMYDVNLLFNCLQPGIDHEVMASQVPSTEIDWGSLQAATTAEVDAYLNIEQTNLISATRTFTSTQIYQIGNTPYVVPATRTKSSLEGESPFDLGILKDGNGNIIFVTHALRNFTRGFNNKVYNYQMILPIRNATNPAYYFFTDPYDTCPQGQGEMPLFGYVEGNATNNLGEPLAGVIVDVAGHTTLTDANGHYNLSTYEGSYKIYGIKSGYQAYVGNVTVRYENVTTHNMILILEAIPNPNTGMGTGPGIGPGTNNNEGPGQDVGPGEDTSSGEAPKVPIVEQPKRIEGVDYVISLNKIDRKIVIGNFLQEFLSFYSYKKSPASLQFSIEGENLSKIVKLDKTSLLLAPNTNDQLTLTIFGEGTPGIYNGSLVVDGDMKEKIPIRIEILTKERLPVESLLLSLDLTKREMYSSEKLKFKADMHNMLSDQQYPVSLYFTLQDTQGNTIWSDSSNVYLQTSFSLLKSVDLPENLKTGDYFLRVTANYLGISSSSTAVFTVTVPFYERTFYGFKVWLWIATATSIMTLALLIYFIRKYQNSKKRYSAKVEYSELPKVGAKAAWVGKIAETEHKTYFDLEQFKVHTIVAGATGGGKSVASQVIVEEALLKGVAVIVFDPTAQWSGMLRKGNDKNMMKLYANFGMKPTMARAFNGNVRQITNALEVIDIKKYIKPGEIQIFALNKLDPKDIDIFVANSIREVFHANFPETPELKLLIVYDEVHRLLPKFGGSGEGFLQIERGCREFRKWGVGILMISQVLADFVGQIKANINTEIQMRTRDEGDLDRIKTKYGTEVLQGLVKASVGSGMVENPTYNRGRPYFVSFRPLLHNTQRLPDEELEKYNKFNEQIDDLQYQLDQLEEEKQDVFDLKLSLKLALDKVKSGNFNMVDIYLQELIPRVEKLWQKIGKQPKKREIKLVDIKSLKDEMKKAEDSRKQFEKENKKAEAEEKVEKKKVLKYEKVVTFDKALNFSNGLTVTSLQELMDVMPTITGPTFKNHVNMQKNDIANWVANAIGDKALAERLAAAKTTQEYVAIFEDDKAKNNKPIDEPTVPTEAELKAKAQADAFMKMSVYDESPQQELDAQDWKSLKEKINAIDDMQKKIKLLEKSAAKYPEDLNIRYSLAILYHKEKDYANAERVYKDILKINPEDKKALFYLGGIMKSQKRYDEALTYFRGYMEKVKSDQKVKELIEKLSARKGA